MTDLVERVARALCDAHYYKFPKDIADLSFSEDGDREDWLRAARAAIAVVLEAVEARGAKMKPEYAAVVRIVCCDLEGAICVVGERPQPKGAAMSDLVERVARAIELADPQGSCIWSNEYARAAIAVVLDAQIEHINEMAEKGHAYHLGGRTAENIKRFAKAKGITLNPNEPL